MFFFLYCDFLVSSDVPADELDLFKITKLEIPKLHGYEQQG